MKNPTRLSVFEGSRTVDIEVEMKNRGWIRIRIRTVGLGFGRSDGRTGIRTVGRSDGLATNRREHGTSVG